MSLHSINLKVSETVFILGKIQHHYKNCNCFSM